MCIWWHIPSADGASCGEGSLGAVEGLADFTYPAGECTDDEPIGGIHVVKIKVR